MKTTACPGCGAVLPVFDGPTHPYMESSPACWSTYTEVLAREYSNPALLAGIHRTTVDTYAVQHPGKPSSQSIQSVAVHLMSLCLMLERDAPPAFATEAIRAAVARKGDFVWLKPPASLGPITVVDVAGTSGAAAHEGAVRAWSQSAWEAWAPHHAEVRAWIDRL
jgi:hypothetical protein